MFSDILKNLRKARELTSDEVAKAVGVSGGAYRNYERGERSPSFETLIKLADFYGVSTDYILGHNEQSDPLAVYALDEEERKFFAGFLNKPHAVRKCVIQTFKPLFENFRFKVIDENGKEETEIFDNLFGLFIISISILLSNSTI